MEGQSSSAVREQEAARKKEERALQIEHILAWARTTPTPTPTSTSPRVLAPSPPLKKSLPISMSPQATLTAYFAPKSMGVVSSSSSLTCQAKMKGKASMSPDSLGKIDHKFKKPHPRDSKTTMPDSLQKKKTKLLEEEDKDATQDYSSILWFVRHYGHDAMFCDPHCCIK